MLTNINPYYMQWNTDVNGNPISVHKQEMQQVSPVYFNIQLDEIPDSFHRLVVVDTEGNMLHEVDNFNRITEQSYYVDYNNGVVYFHQTKGASIVNVTYYGRGFKLIRSSRIVMDDGTKLTDALAQSQVQTASSVGSETEMSLQEQIDTVCKFVRKQQKIIEMLVEEIEKLQK
nr:MAG TPA: hypothetical protein [Bacteriophage sp.]